MQPLVAGAELAGVRKYTTGTGADAGAGWSALAEPVPGARCPGAGGDR